MGTTARVVEYSAALWFAMSTFVEPALRLLVGVEAWQTVPYWVRPNAFELYVPIITANVIVLRYQTVSRRRFWVACFTTRYVSLFCFVLLLIAYGPPGQYSSQQPLIALAFLTGWAVAAWFSHQLIIKNGYRRAYRRFVAYFRV